MKRNVGPAQAVLQSKRVIFNQNPHAMAGKGAPNRRDVFARQSLNTAAAITNFWNPKVDDGNVELLGNDRDQLIKLVKQRVVADFG